MRRICVSDGIVMSLLMILSLNLSSKRSTDFN